MGRLTGAQRAALTFLDEMMEAHPRQIGIAAGLLVKTPRGASCYGGRLARELHRHGYVSPFRVGGGKSPWWRITTAGRAVLSDTDTGGEQP
jgi:hypothetical protein